MNFSTSPCAVGFGLFAICALMACGPKRGSEGEDPEGVQRLDERSALERAEVESSAIAASAPEVPTHAGVPALTPAASEEIDARNSLSSRFARRLIPTVHGRVLVPERVVTVADEVSDRNQVRAFDTLAVRGEWVVVVAPPAVARFRVLTARSDGMSCGVEHCDLDPERVGDVPKWRELTREESTRLPASRGVFRVGGVPVEWDEADTESIWIYPRGDVWFCMTGTRANVDAEELDALSIDWKYRRFRGDVPWCFAGDGKRVCDEMYAEFASAGGAVLESDAMDGRVAPRHERGRRGLSRPVTTDDVVVLVGSGGIGRFRIGRYADQSARTVEWSLTSLSGAESKRVVSEVRGLASLDARAARPEFKFGGFVVRASLHTVDSWWLDYSESYSWYVGVYPAADLSPESEPSQVVLRLWKDDPGWWRAQDQPRGTK